MFGRADLVVAVDPGLNLSVEDEVHELVLQRGHRCVEGRGHQSEVGRQVGTEKGKTFSILNFYSLDGSAQNFQSPLNSLQVIFGRVTWTPEPLGKARTLKKGVSA